MGGKSLWKTTGMHTCAQCCLEKSIEDFVINAAGNPGWCSTCTTDKQREYMREYRNKNPHLAVKKREGRLLKQYNLTPEEFTFMVLEQGGVCAVCELVPSALFVDHNHQTGEVRGLLCQKCNSGIGFLGDSLKSLEKAVNYLKRTDSKEII
jgi:hypothetical protein